METNRPDPLQRNGSGRFFCFHEVSKGSTYRLMLYQMLRNTRCQTRNFSFSSGSNAISHSPIRPMPHPHLQTNPDYPRRDLLGCHIRRADRSSRGSCRRFGFEMGCLVCTPADDRSFLLKPCRSSIPDFAAPQSEPPHFRGYHKYRIEIVTNADLPHKRIANLPGTHFVCHLAGFAKLCGCQFLIRHSRIGQIGILKCFDPGLFSSRRRCAAASSSRRACSARRSSCSRFSCSAACCAATCWRFVSAILSNGGTAKSRMRQVLRRPASPKEFGVSASSVRPAPAAAEA